MNLIESIPVNDRSQVQILLSYGPETALPNLRAMADGYRCQAYGASSEERAKLTKAADTLEGFADATSGFTNAKAFSDAAEAFASVHRPYEAQDTSAPAGSPRAYADAAYDRMRRELGGDDEPSAHQVQDRASAGSLQFSDSVALSGTRTTDDGYLVCEARIARIGVQIYTGAELGKPHLSTVRMLRPESEVFAADTMASFAHRPVTNDHPGEHVKAANWKRFAVGQTGEGAIRDGGYVRVPMVVMDAAAIEAVKLGKRELSAGYSAIIDWTPGTSSTGEAYDAVQRSIRGNHLALVDVARAGPECRIGN
jgi:hypothetical protein